jgi:hypothetical protein
MRPTERTTRFINTEYVTAVMEAIDADYRDALAEEGLQDSPVMNYAIHKMALNMIQTDPMEDRLTQKALELRLTVRLSTIKMTSGLSVTTVPV